ncbi:MAG: sigma-54-dependent Fis family transcriptional regulator [Salinivirgaceae bacterium]|nr:sigma-54-dependent Fis family transcriptional regulator [Salinivirgaceae bacterium]
MKAKPQILVVDDSDNMLEIVRRNLSSKGNIVYTLSNVIDAISFLEKTTVDLVITDLKMPHVNGMELVRHVRENYSNTEVLVITGHPSIENAIESVKLGADEFLIKSFTTEELFSAVEKSLKKRNDRMEANKPRQKTEVLDTGIIGGSKEIIKVFKAISKASKLKATILLTGETGTGKELVARAIHYNSAQVSLPFVAVNCGGIPETLLESELFGYVKGAFTGANETRGGFFQAADGGTIFLDEISNTSLSMQAKLLRVLQEKEVNMIGANKSQKIDLRIIAATNLDLLTLVEKGTFREDLYYRLNIIPIHIPPLRDRLDDIPLLMNYFAKKYADESMKTAPVFTDELIKVFKAYSWPGNVRELENIIQRLVIMTDNQVIDIAELPKTMKYSVQNGKNLNKTLAEIEKEHIVNVLASVDGNKTQAAEILGIDRKTLREKIK